MKICTKRNQPPICSVPLVGGHIYSKQNNSNLYFCGTTNGWPTLHSLVDGNIWSSDRKVKYNSDNWTDVTNQYCLQEK